jgi:histidyl-tRNA synthetase
VFQSAVLGAQSGGGGGGRYDDLVEAIGGPPTPGVGFGTGIERILLALSRSREDLPQAAGPDAYVVAVDDAGREAAFQLAHELRQAGMPVDLDYVGRSVKGQMKQAGRSRARRLILGQEELTTQSVT